MAEGRRMTAAQAVDKLLSSEHADVIRESVRLVLAELMEAEVAEMIGAELGERAPERRGGLGDGPRHQEAPPGTAAPAATSSTHGRVECLALK
jgi:transposase-like protein